MSDESLPTTEFCKKWNIDWFPINLTISGTEKILNKIEHTLYNCARPNLQDFSDKNLLKARQHLFRTQPELFTHLCMDTTNVFHIDIDTEDYQDEFDCIARVSPWFPSMTKSYGKHIFCLYDGFVPSAKRMQFLNYDRTNEVELLCGVGSFAPFVIQNAGFRIYDLKSDTYKVTLDMPQPHPKQRQQNLKKEVPKIDNQFEKIKALCEIIDDKYICAKGCYEHWRNILWALRSESEDYKELAREMSDRKGANFDDSKFESVWDSFKEGDFTIGTFYHYCQKSDEKMYHEIMTKYQSRFISIDDLTDIYKCCQVITPTLRKTLILCKEKWWVLDEKQLWSQIKEPKFYITTEIRKYIDFSQNKNSKQIMVSDGAEKDRLIAIGKEYLKFYEKINQTAYLSTCKDYLKAHLVNNNFEETLDKNCGFLSFKNGVMDLKTGIFREGIRWDDFITETIPYDWKSSDPEKVNFLKGILKKILNNNEEHLDYYLSIIGYSLIGKPDLEKSIYFMIDGTDNGKGDNGKTLFFDILSTLLPCYVYKSKGTLLEDGNAKVHKQLFMTKGKRLVWLDEFSKTKTTNAVLLKEIADGKTIENEVLFGTSETINILFKMFILSNYIPKVDPNEEAVFNRYKQVSFGSHFDRSGLRKQENPENLLFIADCGLADKIKSEFYNEVFSIIVDYAKRYLETGLKIPQKFIEDAKDTKMKNDEFAVWFNDNCTDGGRLSIELVIEKSGFKRDFVIDGMKRMGFYFNREMGGMGKNKLTGKYYKGAFEGCSFIEENIRNEE